MDKNTEHRRPPMMKTPQVTDLGDGIYNIATPPGGFNQYLILGGSAAALIDTGMGIVSLKAEVDKLTSLPVTVINTHGHPDHAGGNAEFEHTLMNPADMDVFRQMATKEFRLGDVSHMGASEEMIASIQPTAKEPAPVEDGAEIDLGGRVLQIIYAPGHTHGSLCVLDKQTGTLFTGDNVQGRNTSLHEWNSSTLPEFEETLKRLAALKPTKLLGGHAPNILPPEYIEKLLGIIEDITSGRAEGKATNMRGVDCIMYERDGMSVTYQESNRKCAAEPQISE